MARNDRNPNNNQSDLFVVRMEILINKNEYSVGDSKNFIFSNWRPKKEEVHEKLNNYYVVKEK